ncbi:hypothetical protein ACFWD7_51070 [Streptomyces mirabilis]|nr:hypothetical protein [Streptomyces mirabilis]MCT9113886.1 hypothetical protein [Streptomyces mirabilis]
MTQGSSTYDASVTMNGFVDAVRFTGGIGLVGVFLPDDRLAPGAFGR